MAKGSKRQRIKDVLSPVRDLVSPSSSRSSASNDPTPSSSFSLSVQDDDSDVLDDLMAELDARDNSVAAQAEAGQIVREMQAASGSSTPKQSSKDRHQARQERKATHLADKYAPVDTDAEARLALETKEEERAITEVCKEQDLEMHEITPDGHCLFSAIADQLSLLSLLPSSEASYTTTRSTAAKFILEHRDDFLPFLPSVSGEDGAGATDDGIMTPAQFEQYCRNMAETGEWGGEPEILALSRAFSVPIHVVQSGTPRIVIHEPTDGPPKTTKPVMISYHRRMYGLGEHYNSLRPRLKSSKLANTLSSII